MKKILVTGKNSYAGKKFIRRINEKNQDWVIESISVRDNDWFNLDFSSYDAIYHVAAIVHKKEDKAKEKEYFKVNSDLPYKIALKAKAEGVESFIFLSSIAVYGIIGEMKDNGGINKETPENPKTLNGKSKLLAENNLKGLNDENFKVSILRVPLIYGENCPGNYSLLLRLSKFFPVFPKVNNTRSMVHIDRLTDVVAFIIRNSLEGLFLVNDPQNVNTSDLYRKLRMQQEKKTYLSPLLGILIMTLGRNIPMLQKLFGNMYYDLKETYIFGFNEGTLNK